MVKQGYKQTEIGVIPEDWDCVAAKHLMKIETGSRNTEHKTDIGKYPFFVRSQKVERIDTYHYDCEAVLTAGDGVGTGKVFHHYIGKFDAHQRVYVMSNFDGITGRFFYNYFSENFGNEVSKYTAKSSVDSVRRDMIAEMLIPTPPIPEQNRIAEALSDVDGMISSLEKLIAKKKAVKQGAMQELLMGKKRLPGFDGEWNKIELKELIKEFIVPMRDKPKDLSGPIPWCRIEDFNGKYLYSSKTNQGVTIETISNMNLKVFPKNTLLVSCSAFLGRCAIVGAELITNQTFIGLVPNNKVNVEFLFYVMIGEEKNLNLLSSGTTISYLSREQFEDYKIYIPCDVLEQTAIASILTDMDNEIEALEQKLAKTRQIKQGMMQQLLTGKIRFTGKDEDIPRKRTLHSANIYFKRAVLAAEIASRLYQESTFGHVKMEKLLFLTEKLCDIDLNSNYHRDAAGPYDNRALRSIDSQLKKQKWFDVVTIDRARRYIPMEKSGTHSEYFKRYYNHILQTFNFIISTFQKMNTEQCEIVATLYSAWEDFLLDGCVPNDSMIVEEVLNNWHNSKKRISQERWESALNWMRQKNIIPKQRGSM